MVEWYTRSVEVAVSVKGVRVRLPFCALSLETAIPPWYDGNASEALNFVSFEDPWFDSRWGSLQRIVL